MAAVAAGTAAAVIAAAAVAGRAADRVRCLGRVIRGHLAGTGGVRVARVGSPAGAYRTPESVANDPVPDGAHELGNRIELQLVHDVAAMGLDGLHA